MLPASCIAIKSISKTRKIRGESPEFDGPLELSKDPRVQSSVPVVKHLGFFEWWHVETWFKKLLLGSFWEMWYQWDTSKQAEIQIKFYCKCIKLEMCCTPFCCSGNQTDPMIHRTWSWIERRYLMRDSDHDLLPNSLDEMSSNVM